MSRRGGQRKQASEFSGMRSNRIRKVHSGAGEEIEHGEAVEQQEESLIFRATRMPMGTARKNATCKLVIIEYQFLRQLLPAKKGVRPTPQPSPMRF